MGRKTRLAEVSGQEIVKSRASHMVSKIEVWLLAQSSLSIRHTHWFVPSFSIKLCGRLLYAACFFFLVTQYGSDYIRLKSNFH
jgi:hypothetical protein